MAEKTSEMDKAWRTFFIYRTYKWLGMVEMRRKVLIGLVLMSLAVGILSVVPNVSGVEDVAMVIDIEGIETKVNDLYIYHAWVSRYGLPGHETKRSLEIRKGETELTIPFTNIREMEFEWGEGQSTVTISTVSGERIKGMPQCSGRTFKGETDYGYFELSMYKTKKVIFSQIQIQDFSIQDIQKSSETAPEINIEPIEEQKLPNTTVLLSGSASTDSGIKSVTVNGQYVGTEYWSAPVDLSLGDNNIVIVATGNDGSTTVENISLSASPSFTPDSKSWISKYIIPNILPLLILLLGTGLFTEIIRRYRKRRHQRPPT